MTMKKTLLLSIQTLLATTLFAQDWVAVSPLGGLTDGQIIRTAIEYNGNLVVGGEFTEIADQPIEVVAMWDGTAWTQVGEPLADEAYCFVVYNNELYVGGNVYNVDGNSSHTILKLVNNSWVGVDPNDEIGVIEQMLVWNNELYVATNQYGRPNRVMKYNGTTWTQVGTTLPVGEKYQCLEVFENELYVGGNFINLNGANRIAKFDGSDWTSVDFPLSIANTPNVQQVIDMEIHDGKLFAAGDINHFEGEAVGPNTCLASFDGTNWLGYTPDTTALIEINTLKSFDDELFCGGNFAYAEDGEVATGVIIYNPADNNDFMNSNFYAASQPGGEVRGLAEVNNELVAVGSFIQAGSATNSFCMAKFNGVIPTPSSILERERVQNLGMYPNPTNGNVQFNLKEKGTVRVYDMTGSLIRQEAAFSGTNTTNLSNLPTGIYRVQVITEAAVYSGGIVKN